MNKKLLYSILVIIIAGGGYYYFNRNTSPVNEVNSNIPASDVNTVNKAEDENTSLKTYNKDNEFTLKYPADFILTTGEGLGGEFLDQSIVKISMPGNSFKDENTNYNEAYAVISKSTKPEIVSGCLAFSDVPSPMSSDIGTSTVNGIAFRTEKTSDAAAGNIYDSELYRTVNNNACYEISLTVHTGNIHNYEPPVKEFDKEKAYVKLEEVLNTFNLSR